MPVTPYKRQLTFTERAIVAEAEARGWTVSYLPDTDKYFCIQNTDGKRIWFRGSLPETSSFIGNRLSLNKLLAARFLESIGYNMPACERVSSPEHAEHFLRQHSPIVVKPEYGEQGEGITVGVQDVESLHRAIGEAAKKAHAALMQEQLSGSEYRLLVIGNRVFAAKRMPLSVRGDGVSTLHALLSQVDPSVWPAVKFQNMLDALKRHYTESELNRIPAKNEEVLFAQLQSASLGGSTEDVTDDIHPSYKEVLIDITKRFRLTICGFDLLVQDISAPCPDTLPLLELNSMPGFLPHMRPVKGESRNVAQTLLDHVFGDSNNAENY